MAKAKETTEKQLSEKERIAKVAEIKKLIKQAAELNAKLTKILSTASAVYSTD